MSKLNTLFPEELRPAGKGGGKPGPVAGAAAPAQGGRARTFVSELSPGQEVEGVYLVQDASLRAAKNGSKYIQASVGDRTGSIPVRFWDATEKDFAALKPGGYARVRGRVETYQNRPQMIVFNAQAAEAAQVDAADFLAVSTRDPAEMAKELDALVAGIADSDYRRLLAAIFSDAKVRPAFLCAPAASAIHHAWVHGLLEHVLSAAKTAQAVAEQRPFLNKDLLLAGVLLHDVGKIEEIDAGPGFSYTDPGRLCGHISLGSLLVERFILALKDFPPAKRDLLQHMILSHHGEREHGSPVTPATAEAVALHHIECMDAKVQGIRSAIEKDESAGNTGAWTDFQRVVDGRIYKG